MQTYFISQQRVNDTVQDNTDDLVVIGEQIMNASKTGDKPNVKSLY